jgi:L-ascorbate metabolism protein UlaG (beta-lactamase superfamily)
MTRRSGIAAALLTVALCVGVDGEERFPARAGDVVVRPLAHASVRVDYRDLVVYVDPWSRANLAGAPPADLILVTDADAGAHHLDTAAIQRLRKPETKVVIPASAQPRVADGIVMANGTRRAFGDVTVEAVGSYDLIPGEPFHAKGVANGYVLTLGGLRIFFAGVTECVPEIKALRNIDVAFMPMNLPNGRMTPAAAATCLAEFRPRVVFPYHYDQGYIARLSGRGTPGGEAEAARSVRTLADLLTGRVDVRAAEWYPVN